MHKVTFYNLGNADTTLIQLDKGKNILIDYANMRDSSNNDDKRCNLPSELDKVVTEDSFDAVCFTHLDNDHIKGSSEYFYFLHAKKYQGDNRKKIEELWVPASVIIPDKNDTEAKIIQAEARYRLRNNIGIRVISKPEKLKKWCKKNGIDFDKIKHRVVDAGTCIPSLTISNDGAEFFVHSPFKGRVDEGILVDRNREAVVFQVTFDNSKSSSLILGSDIGYEVWEDIINVTKFHNNETRLEWDIFHISHHSSYKSLAPEKGKTKTKPSNTIKWLYENQARPNSTMVSPSNPIPFTCGGDGEQPPHRQAWKYYDEDVSGTVKVTMEYPNISKPKPMKFEIGNNGVKLSTVSSFMIGGSSPKSRPSRVG